MRLFLRKESYEIELRNKATNLDDELELVICLVNRVCGVSAAWTETRIAYYLSSLPNKLPHSHLKALNGIMPRLKGTSE